MKKNISGNSLISVLFFMIVLSLLVLPIMSYYDDWKDQKRASDTMVRLDTINKTIREFAAANGYYPCPANIRSGFDTVNFGQSASNECNTGSPAGFSGQTKRSGRAKDSGAINHVRAGAVPVRTLGLPDNYIYDGYNHRYVYVVTEAYAAVASDGTPPNIPELDRNDSTGVFVEDINEHSATRKTGNAVYAVISMGDTTEGSYSANGALLGRCPAGVANCSLEATIQNTVSISEAEGPGRFTQTVRYDTPQPCISSENTPNTIAFLLDSSGSMGAQGGEQNISRLPLTPDDIAPSPIWRVHPAQWALRRALIARNVAMSPENNPGGSFETVISSFRTNFDWSYREYSNSNTDQVEDILRNPLMCPRYGSGTPLGATVRSLADQIRGGREGGPPNKIIALVDGGGDRGAIVSALRHIRDTYGTRLQVNFIDTVNSTVIPEAIAESGVTSATATYISTVNDPDTLVYELLHSSNGCSISSVPEPLNERYYCTPPTCEEMGTCPTEPTCEETGTCPPCEETGTCPSTPTCHETGTCPPDPITLNSWMQIAIPMSAPASITISESAFKLQGYDQGRGVINEVGFDSTDDGVDNPTYYRISGTGTSVDGNIGTMRMRMDGNFVFTSDRNVSGTDMFYMRGVVTNPGPSNGISTMPFPVMNLGGTPQAAGNVYSVISRLNQVMARITMVEVNGVERSVPATGNVTFDGTNGRLTINRNGAFTYRGFSGRTGMDYFYLKGPILESGTPLVIRDPVPLGVANSYQWELNFRVRNGNGGRPLTGQLLHNGRGTTVEEIRFGSMNYAMTGDRRIVEGEFGTLNIRRDGYFSYRARNGATGSDDFHVNGLAMP